MEEDFGGWGDPPTLEELEEQEKEIIKCIKEDFEEDVFLDNINEELLEKWEESLYSRWLCP